MQILRNRDQQAGQEGFGGRADADPCMVTPRLNPLGRPRCHREKRFRLTSSLTGCYTDYTVRGLDATRVPLIKVCRPHDLQEETGMITTVTRLGYRVIAVSFLCAAYGASALQAQQTVPLTERVQILNVDSLYAGMWVYYSRGYKDRAEAIGRQITASNQFYEESLGIDVDIRVALLDTVDHQRASISLPYGLPFISEGIAVLPADLATGAVVEMYAPFESTASAEILADLREAGFSYAEANRRMVDLIGLHEIGHAQVTAYGIDARQRWFNELLASYFAYAYMQRNEPTNAVVWDRVTQAGREGHTPSYTSLDDFNRLYLAVGVSDYGWYQNVFQKRIQAVYEEHGLDFLRRVRECFSNPEWRPESAAELLDVLEGIAPGFLAWSAELGR